MTRAPYTRNSLKTVTSVAVVIAFGCSIDWSAEDWRDAWDSDGDGISTAVEIQPANAEYHFDTTRVDHDPSVPGGSPGNGWLDGGINYPDNDWGKTYEFRPNPPGSRGFDPRYDQPDSNDWATLDLIKVVERTGREWDPAFSNDRCDSVSLANRSIKAFRFGVGDMSKRGGGTWYHSYNGDTRHDSHQNGLDVDVRYLRKDRGEIPLDLSTDGWAYDTAGTIDLMLCFLFSNQIELILADSTALGFWNNPGQNRPLVHDANHHNHFHVRVFYP